MKKILHHRRSWMIVPAHDPKLADTIAQYKPDVVVLDLEYSVAPKYKEQARANLVKTVSTIATDDIEIFVRIDKASRWADVDAAMQRGLTGIIFCGVDEESEITEIDALINTKEKERGIDPGHIELVIILESAKGFWNLSEILQASPRLSAVGVGRIDLTMQLGPVPQDEFRLFRYLMTRTLVAGKMHGKQLLGAMWRPDSRGGVANQESTKLAAQQAKLMGYTGCICATPEQVYPLNLVFLP